MSICKMPRNNGVCVISNQNRIKSTNPLIILNELDFLNVLSTSVFHDFLREERFACHKLTTFYPRFSFVWDLFFSFSMCKSSVFLSNTRNYYLQNLAFTKPCGHFAKTCTGEERYKANISPR